MTEHGALNPDPCLLTPHHFALPPMNDHTSYHCNTTIPLLTRRDILRMVSCGFGYLAFASLVSRAAAAESAATGAGAAAANPLAPKVPHFAARARRVIFLTMRGGPSHVDTFDYKPKLTADTGKPGKRPGTSLLGSKWKFSQHGRSGLWVSELFPNVAKHADEICMIRSMQTDLPAHPQAFL